MYKYSLPLTVLLSFWLLLCAADATSSSVNYNDPTAVNLPASKETLVNQSLIGTPTTPFKLYFTQAQMINSNQLAHGEVLSDHYNRRLIVAGSDFYVADIRPNSESDTSSKPAAQFSAGVYQTLAAPKHIHGEGYSGYLLQPVGRAKWVKNYDAVGVFKLLSSEAELATGDWLLPNAQLKVDYPERIKTIDKKLTGQVVAAVQDAIYTGENHSIVITMGKQQGIPNGLLVYLKTPVSKTTDANDDHSYQIPSTIIGKALVYNVGESLSIALVLESTEEISQGTLVTTHEY